MRDDGREGGWNLTEAQAAALVALATQIRDELRGLRADIAARRESGPPVPVDFAALAQLLPAIAEARGSSEFAARDLIAEHPELVPIAGRSVKSLGQLFARGAGHAIAGYILRHYGDERGVGLWQNAGH